MKSVYQHFWTLKFTKFFGPEIISGPKFIGKNFFPTLNTTQFNSKQLKVTKVEVRYSSHIDFENGVIGKIYKS